MRKRAYVNARIETRDGRRGTIISAYADHSQWRALFDAPSGLRRDATDLEWVHRRDFYLFGEERNPFVARNNIEP